MHRIHLRGPWEVEWLHKEVSADDGATVGRRETEGGRREAGTLGDGVHRVHMPAAWASLFGKRTGAARFRRWFHKPTNLDPDECVRLVFEGLGGTASASLNHHSLGQLDPAPPACRIDVTSLLLERNELIVDITHSPRSAESGAGGLWGPVVLEITSRTQGPTSE